MIAMGKRGGKKVEHNGQKPFMISHKIKTTEVIG